uniref:C-type lectin domain-containing protein n=1 Tax=Oreochromis niloticus TaxID=8128 RepID=A0A669EQ60_ORENI
MVGTRRKSFFAIACDLANGWMTYGSNCYKFKSDTRKSWTSARHDCVADGADLVSITSAEENQFVTSPTGISMWMGGHDSITEGGWEWTDGSPPNLIMLINNGYWNDDNCGYKRGYVCKRRGEK